MPESPSPAVNRPVRSNRIILRTILAALTGFVAWQTFFPGGFKPRFTATLMAHSRTNRIGYIIWVGSPAHSNRSVFLSTDPDPHLMGDQQVLQVRTNQSARRLRFEIVNTGSAAVRQSTARRLWYGVDWQIDGEWVPGADSGWFFFRDDLIVPGEARNLEILLPEAVTAVRLRWLAQPASSLYRLAWKHPSLFSTRPGEFLWRHLDPEVDPCTEVFTTSDPIPLQSLPSDGISFELR